MFDDCFSQKGDKDMYVQCTVTRPSGPTGTDTRTFWANSDKAVVGREVKVEGHDGTWTTGWTVRQVHGTPMPRSYVQHQSHAHTRQRKASDI